MIQIALERMARASSDDPYLLRLIQLYQVKLLDALSAEHCLYCKGFGHSMGTKCSTFVYQVNLAQAFGSKGFADLFQETLLNQFKAYKLLNKPKLEDQLRLKSSSIAEQISESEVRFTQEGKSRKKEQKLKEKVLTQMQE